MNRLLQLFSKTKETSKTAKPEPEAPAAALEAYNGLRVEVTSMTEILLFVATLLAVEGDTGKLHPVTQARVNPKEEGVPVKIRGFSTGENKAVYLEGRIFPEDAGDWKAEGLSLVRTANDRAFFRHETQMEAHLAPIGKIGAQEEACKLLNISVGGACVRATGRYDVGDKFLLKVGLQEGKGETVFFSEVRRAIEKDGGMFEYGCRFTQLSELEQEQITQAIFDLQRIRRNNV